MKKICMLLSVALAVSGKLTAQSEFHMGTSANPEGVTICADSVSMLIGGKPVVPVMGEFHYSRFDESDWHRELLKMKAGGIDIVATYVFWNHHEEEEGVYMWKERRNLRRFVEECGKAGLMCVLRLGPWAHGECREGGLPDWLIEKYGNKRLRGQDEAYLSEVKKWYGQIGEQVKGLMWKDGGPIVGVQLENEYRGKWEHLATLKSMAIEAGFDVPLYTRTGWPQLTSPAKFGEILPLYGDYCDGFWDRSLKDMPGNYKDVFVFRSFRNSTVIATEQLPPQPGEDNRADLKYPFFTCELGGGMMPSYHRRIKIDPRDIYSVAVVKVGSGSNMPGYYMYHGGTNPVGVHSYLNESQKGRFTNHNDLPCMTYDFQAPLREFGQFNGQFFMLKALHMFLDDFGGALAGMKPSLPYAQDAREDSLLRWSWRGNGKSGFVFFNNHHRLQKLSDKQNITFRIPGVVDFPSSPICIPTDAVGIMPYGLGIGEMVVEYATVQPLARIVDGNCERTYFFNIEGVDAEMCLSNEGARKVYRNIKPGFSPVVEWTDNGVKHQIFVISSSDAMNAYRVRYNGKEHLVVCSVPVYADGDSISVEATGLEKCSMTASSEFIDELCKRNGLKASRNGAMKTVEFSTECTEVEAKVSLVHGAGEPRHIVKGARGVAEAPADSDFASAARWEIYIPDEMRGKDLLIRIPYVGDVARFYADGKFVTDNFYNGNVFEVGVKDYPADKYILEVLPLQKDTPIYLQSEAMPGWKDGETVRCTLDKVHVYERRICNFR